MRPVSRRIVPGDRFRVQPADSVNRINGIGTGTRRARARAREALASALFRANNYVKIQTK
jgi:hypothetical protein